MAHTMLLLSFLLLIALVDWKNFFLLSALGSAGALLISRCYSGAFLPQLSWGAWWDVTVKLSFTTFIGLLFMRKKELHGEQKRKVLSGKSREQRAKLQIAADRQAQLVDSLDSESSVLSEINERMRLLRVEGANEAHISRIESALAYLKELKIKSDHYLPLHPKRAYLMTLLDRVDQKLERIGTDLLPKVYRRHSQDAVVCDANHLEKLMVNALQHMALYHPDNEVHLYLDDANIEYGPAQHQPHPVACYRLTISNQPQTLEHEAYTFKSQKIDFDQDRQHLEENQYITEAHYGIMRFEQQENTCIQSYVLPYNLHDIRPKISRFTDENLNAKTRLDAPEDIAFLNLVKKKKLDVALVKKALLDCKHYHRNQVRKSGEPYYLHPLRVTTELLGYPTDLDKVIVALLHDTVEDTPYTQHQIETRYGQRVGELVAALTNLYNESNRKIKLQKPVKFAAMLEKSEEAAMVIKLFDRLDNTRTLAAHTPEKRSIIAHETFDLYVPIAKRLGYEDLAKELISLCEPYLNPAG
ncbi:MAG: HD domain-containing protein [Cytophagales bacterium]